MGFIKLNRHGDPTGCTFDVAAVIDKVHQAFADVMVLPGDQLALSADRAVVAGAAEHVVRTLRRNQAEYGPAYAFEIPIGDGRTIQGRARRYDVTFLFAEPLPSEWRRHLLDFMHSLGPGRIEQSADGPPPPTADAEED